MTSSAGQSGGIKFDSIFSISWRRAALWILSLVKAILYFCNSCRVCDQSMHVCAECVCFCYCRRVEGERGDKNDSPEDVSRQTVLTEGGIDLCPAATHPYSQRKMVLIKCHLSNNHTATQRPGARPGPPNVSTPTERAGVNP